MFVESIARWSMTSVIHRILDLQWSGEILWIQQPKFMLLNLFNRLAWGGVQLPGPVWGPMTLILIALGIAGCGLRARSLVLWGRTPLSRARFESALHLPVFVLGPDLGGGGPVDRVQFMWMDNLHLSDIRYTYPAIAITVGFMVLGIRQLGLGQPGCGGGCPGS